MCNRARMSNEPETLRERFGAKWLAERVWLGVIPKLADGSSRVGTAPLGLLG